MVVQKIWCILRWEQVWANSLGGCLACATLDRSRGRSWVTMQSPDSPHSRPLFARPPPSCAPCFSRRARRWRLGYQYRGSFRRALDSAIRSERSGNSVTPLSPWAYMRRAIRTPGRGEGGRQPTWQHCRSPTVSPSGDCGQVGSRGWRIETNDRGRVSVSGKERGTKERHGREMPSSSSSSERGPAPRQASPGLSWDRDRRAFLSCLVSWAGARCGGGGGGSVGGESMRERERERESAGPRESHRSI